MLRAFGPLPIAGNLGNAMSQSKRLFVAIPLPNAVRNALSQIDLQQPGCKPVAPENLHLTLKFIGNVRQSLTANISAALRSVNLPPFELTIQGVGVFPSCDNPTVLWAGLKQPEPQLVQLQAQIEECLLPLGIDWEQRRYTPHITLARCRNIHPEQCNQLLQQWQNFTLLPFEVERFVLYRSELKSFGAVYLEEETFTLTASGN